MEVLRKSTFALVDNENKIIKIGFVYFCGKIISFKKCSRCKEVFYCSKECQKCDWKTHKLQCNKNSFIVMKK